MPPDTAERSPAEGSVPDGAGSSVILRVTERWFGATLYSRTVTRRPARHRGLADALDHLDELGLCVCWVGPRRHPRREA